MANNLSLDDKLAMPLDALIPQSSSTDRRPRGGGRSRGGAKRFSPQASRPYRARPSKGPTSGNGGAGTTATASSTRVYVGNLSWQTSWQDLKDHMRQAGNVERADILLDDA